MTHDNKVSLSLSFSLSHSLSLSLSLILSRALSRALSLSFSLELSSSLSRALFLAKRTVRDSNLLLGSGPPISVEVGKRKCAPRAAAAALRLALDNLIDAIVLLGDAGVPLGGLGRIIPEPRYSRVVDWIRRPVCEGRLQHASRRGHTTATAKFSPPGVTRPIPGKFAIC